MQPDRHDFDLDAHLGPLAERLETIGLAEIARRLRHVAGSPEFADAGLQSGSSLELDRSLGVTEATALLRFRSRSSVLGLIERGVLEGFRHADQLFVSRESVDRFLESPTLMTERRVEEQIWSLLADAEAA